MNRMNREKPAEPPKRPSRKPIRCKRAVDFVFAGVTFALCCALVFAVVFSVLGSLGHGI